MNVLIPLFTTILCLALALFIILHTRQSIIKIFREQPAQGFAAFGLLAFAVGAACQSYALFNGWTINLYRVAFLFGWVFSLLSFAGTAACMLLSRQSARLVSLVLGLSAVFALLSVFENAVVPGELSKPLRLVAQEAAGAALIISISAAFWTMRDFLWNGKSKWRGLGTLAITLGTIAWLVGRNKAGLSPYAPILTVVFWGIGILASMRASSQPAFTKEQLIRRRSRISLYLIGTGVFSILGAVAILPFLPWYMGIGDTQFKSTYIQSVPDENNGVYLKTDQGVLQVYSWSIEPDDFPTDAPVVKSFNLHEFVIVSKQFDVPANYQLYNASTGTQLKWRMVSQHGSELSLDAGPLDPGQYEFITPTDSMFGGSTYQFFEIQ